MAMTTPEFKAFCRDLADKLQDGRALEEAKQRLQAKRNRPRTYEDELELDDKESGVYG